MKQIFLSIICAFFVSLAYAQEENFNASTLPSFNAPWNLRQCIDYAIEHNINIKLQENNVKNQEVSLSTAKNSRLPNLQASAGESFGFGRGLTIDNTYANRNTQSTSFNLGSDVPLYTGGQITNQIKQNKLNLQAAIAELNRAKENVSIQVASAYLEAIYQKDLVAVAENQLALSRNQAHRVELLFKNGKVAETDLAEAQSHVAADELSLTQQKNAAMLALLDLSQLLELPTPEHFDIQQPITEEPAAVVLSAPDAIYAEALNIKPQIQAGKLNVQSAERGVRIAQAGHYPSLHFSAGMGSNYYKTSGFEAASFGKQMEDNFSQSLGFSLSIPIFSRYATRNAVRQARLQVAAQQLQLEDTQKALYKEIQQAYYNAIAAQKQCVSSDAALAASQTSFNLMQKKYENGKATTTEYQESKTALQKAESTALQSRYTFLFRQKILEFYRGTAL
ncbi:MAG: TolC family protein [Bacteroidaceae bacterium]|nr:TolC family protein [Bacteroidaceae bacterium]